MDNEKLIKWLLKADVSIQYQVHRDLLSIERNDLRKKIATEGWGAKLLSKRQPEGYWGQKFYQPKWTSSHYTLLDLRNLCIEPDRVDIQESIELILRNERGKDGGINPKGSIRLSDVCVNGMFLNYASYFKVEERKLEPILDFILSQYMPDGGFNCRSNRSGAVHSSLHTTLSVLEGITEYVKNGYRYRLADLKKVAQSSKEFMLLHQLFLSDKTGEIIHKDFLKLSYPGRWKYDILRALDYFQYSHSRWDERMKPAIEMLIQKKTKDNRWKLQAKHPGQVHIEMEKAGKPSRWNTLRALRILKHFGINNHNFSSFQG